MVIYHAGSYYQTLVCIVHSYLQNDAEKILLITNSIKYSFDIKKLAEFFDKVIYINVREGFSDLNSYHQDILKYFNDIWKEHNICINGNTAIYVGGYHFNFGTYLAICNIPFFGIEEANGLLSRSEHIKDIDAFNRQEIKIIEKMGLYDGSNPNIRGILCNKHAQEKGYVNEKMIHFDVSQEIEQIDKEGVQKILHVFGNSHKISIPNNSILVLTQHYANLNIMTYERQALLYGLVFDYFFNKRKIVIKKHPADVMAYNAIFPNVIEIKEQFLSEFIPYFVTPLPKAISCISSTGIVALKNVISEQISFDFNFEKCFESIHKVYIALKIVEQLGGENKICCMGVNTHMIKNLIKCNNIKVKDINIGTINIEEMDENTVLIIDDTQKCDLVEDYSNIEKISEYFANTCRARAIIFINSEKQYIFHNSKQYNVWKNIIPIHIEKKNMNTNRNYEIYDDFRTETIYLFSQHQEVKQKVMEYRHEKVLENLEMEISKREIETKEELQISILKGMLEATEKRLLYYMDICKNQKFEIEKLKNSEYS